jgi:APA family basic amino acid/polyamine antiporter
VTFRRVLGPFDTTMLVVGAIVGAGIFINPSIVAARLPSAGWVLAAWVVGGAVALAGAFAYAELGSLAPRAGGQYAYLRDAFHPLAGFLYGWALLTTIESGALAAVAITFAEYTLRLVGRGGAPATPLAVGAIVTVSVVNYLGVRPGSRVLNVFVVAKIAALAALIVAAASLPAAAPRAADPSRVSLASLPLAFGSALVPILFAYGGWQNANYVAEEIRDPARTLPRALVAGTALVVLVYVLVNVAYLRALGAAGLAATLTPAADTAGRVLGAAGDRFVAAAIAVSTFGFLDLGVLAPTRVYYAMAADGAFFPAVARVHPRYRTPSLAILLQSTWCVVLAVTGTYGELLNSVVFADWIFFGLTVASLFIFRRRVPIDRRPPGCAVTPGYPLLPAAFVAVAVAVVLSVVLTAPVRSAMGAAVLASGIPVYYAFVRKNRPPAADRSRAPSPGASG